MGSTLLFGEIQETNQDPKTMSEPKLPSYNTQTYNEWLAYIYIYIRIYIYIYIYIYTIRRLICMYKIHFLQTNTRWSHTWWVGCLRFGTVTIEFFGSEEHVALGMMDWHVGNTNCSKCTSLQTKTIHALVSATAPQFKLPYPGQKLPNQGLLSSRGCHAELLHLRLPDRNQYPLVIKNGHFSVISIL